MKTTLFLLCAFLVHSQASAAPPAREGTVPPSRRVEADSEIPRLLGPVDRMIDRAHATVAKGLRARTSSQSLAAFRRADHTYDAALRRLDRIAGQHAGEAPLMNALEALRSRARDGTVDAAIHTGHVYLARTDYQGAVRAANQALSIDPDDAVALELRDTAATLPSYGWFGAPPFRFRPADARLALELRPMTGAMRSMR